jgi:hypothetical protein
MIRVEEAADWQGRLSRSTKVRFVREMGAAGAMLPRHVRRVRAGDKADGGTMRVLAVLSAGLGQLQAFKCQAAQPCRN